MWREVLTLAVAAPLLLSSAARADAQSFGTTADTYVDSHLNTNNFGNLTFVEVALGGLPKNTIDRGLLAFDVSVLPIAATIARARLQLVISDTSRDPLGLPITVASLASPFDENTVTWDTQPPVLPGPTATATMNSAPGETFSIDVTELVRAQRAGADPSHVLLRIAPSSEDPVPNTLLFDFVSKESTPDQRAQLIIELAATAPLLSAPMLVVVLLLIAGVGCWAMRRRADLAGGRADV